MPSEEGQAEAERELPAPVTGPRSVGIRWARLGIAGCVICFGLGCLGELHWFLELFSHFRVQYLASLTGLGLLSCALGERRWGILALLLSLAMGLFLVPFYWPSDEPEPDAATYRLINFNVFTANRSEEEVEDWLLEQDADLILLLEVNTRWVAALERLAARYPYRVLAPRSDNFGIAFFSRHPFPARAAARFGGGLLPSVSVEVELSGKTLRFVGTHALPPTNRQQSQHQRDQLKAVASDLAEHSGHRLLAGDFNASPWSATYQRLVAESGLRDSQRGHGLGMSWRHGSVLALPIDHVFHSESVQVLRRRLGPALGSDHSPVIVDFVLR